MAIHALETEGHHFTCIRTGRGCVAPHVKEEGFFFMHPKMKKEMQADDAHDDTLFKLTDKINQLVKDTASKRKDRNLRIAVTSKGFVWVWTKTIDNSSDTATEWKALDDNALLEIFGLKQSTSKD